MYIWQMSTLEIIFDLVPLHKAYLITCYQLYVGGIHFYLQYSELAYGFLFIKY